MPTTISSLLHDFTLTLRHKGRTAATIKAYACDLRAAAAAFPGDISEIPRAALEAWLAEVPTASTQARKLASLRTFFAWCLARELIARDPTLGLEARSTTRRLPRPVKGDGDRAALDAAIGSATMPYRLIFTLLREAGMRVGEVLALNVSDVSLAPGQEGLHVRDPKNRVERVVILGPNSTEKSVRLLRRHLKALGPDMPPTHPLFCSNRKTRTRYTTVVWHWNKLCAGAGLIDPEGKPRYTIHQLRHTAATELLEEGHKIETVQRRLGHRDIRTTMGYAEVSDAAIRAELEGGPRR
ncbi:tyrosine-type recombinase/integrase [Oscillochloris sp. ZM17-4]|uniref:tyrosine-type recombinase/integrase n=1 Tax=Oscillochloris sp. ZM17-4 TaxID=2866714 RepID=UPI001C738999|nr:tyrosine-type recombinase/integrase [Oscillochloris sp. ZM17-4]MBX0330931.1 tyrosine-type recombinase/integrase [Oscillochloris sp. ZM17-4]